MTSKAKKARVWTYRDAREIAAGTLAAAALLAVMHVAAGLAAHPLLALAGLAALGLCWGIGAWQRELRDLDSHWIDTVERLRVPMLLSFALGGALFLGTLLLVHAGIWTAWLMVAAPASAVLLVRTAFLLSDADHARLARVSTLLLFWSLAAPSAATWTLFGLGLLAAFGMGISDQLWEQTRSTIWKGRILPREWMVRWVPAAAAFIALATGCALLTPRLEPRWNLTGAAMGNRPVEIVVDMGGRKKPGREPETPDEPLTFQPEKPPRHSPGPGPGPVQPPPRRIVVKPPGLDNVRNLLDEGLALLRERGPALILVAVASIPALYGIWKLWGAFRRRRRPGEGPLEEFLRQVRTRAKRRVRQEEAAPEEARRAVIFHYNRWRDSADRHGYKKQPFLAPAEYARFLAVRLTDRKAAIERLTERFEAACYSPRPIAETDRAEAETETRAFLDYFSTKR